MIIDILCLLFVLMAAFKGFSKGLIVAVFSFVGFIIGLAAALKFSTTVADYLRKDMSMGSTWLPFISFAIVFIGVVILVGWAVKLLKGAVSLVLLGWVDTIGGLLFYLCLYMMIFSVLLFYATQLQLISPQMQADSKSYHVIKPWAPWVIDGIGKVIPFFKNMFADLQHFFGTAAR